MERLGRKGKSPLPPRWGKGRGWGCGAPPYPTRRRRQRLFRRSQKPLGSTPTQPSPIEGEGFERNRTPIRTVKRARRLRAEPTWTEAKLWERLRELPVRFRRQGPVGPYVADFICHRASLVVEIDGDVHNLTDVALRDLKRDAWFEGQGHVTLRVSTREVEADMDGVVTRIQNLASNRIGKVI